MGTDIIGEREQFLSPEPIVCYTAVISVVTQRSSPLTSGEERCVTTLITAV